VQIPNAQKDSQVITVFFTIEICVHKSCLLIKLAPGVDVINILQAAFELLLTKIPKAQKDTDDLTVY